MPSRNKNLDSAQAPSRRYQAPSLGGRSFREVPPEYRTLKKAKKNNGAGFLWFLFLLFLAALGGFIFWSKQNVVNVSKSLELEVTGPESIISGDQATYVIKYKNTDIVTLQEMELSARMPAGFYFDEASQEPADQNATTWRLSDIQPGDEATIEIKGQLVGAKDETLSAVFDLTYVPQNFQSEFNAKQTIDTKISDSKLEMSIQSVDKTLVSTEQEIKILYKNLTSEALTDLYLDVLYPDDMEIVSVDPIKDGDYWKFNIAPNEEKTLTIRGSFGTDASNDQLLVAAIGNMASDKFRPLSRVEKKIVVINPDFDIDFEINGSDKSQTVDWGDVLRYQATIINQSPTDISDVEITALIESQAVDWDTLDTVGKFDKESSKIVWTKEVDESLATWKAGETKTFTWQVKVNDESGPERNIENILQITIAGLTDWQSVSNPILLTVGEGVIFNNGVYWDLGGRRVGSGALPPQVGGETEYLVIWSIPEATGDFDSVKVETTLPPQTWFLEEMDIQEGTLTMDESSQVLTWQIDDFKDLLLPVTASFVIKITPEADNQGQSMTVLNATTLTASGDEEVKVRSKMITTSDVMADTNQEIGIVE